MSEELKPCPFCGAGSSEIVENGKVWTGMKYGEPSSVSIRHHCETIQGQPSRMLERVGRDRASAIAAWNMRSAALLAEDKGGEVVAWTVPGKITDWSKDFSAYQTKTYTRPVYTHPQQQAAPQKSALTLDRPMTFGGCPFCGSQQCVAGQCQQQAAQAAGPQGWKLAKVPVDTPDDDWGEPIVYDTNEIDQITHALTGDEGEDDSVTVLHRFVAHMKAVYPGKNMTQVLIETEEQRLSAAPVAAPEQAAQAAVPQWQPIDTAPKDGTVILVTDTFTYRSDPDKKPHHVYRAVRWNEEGYGWEIYNDGEIIDQDGPTFWMPLPAEPGDMLSAACGAR